MQSLGSWGQKGKRIFLVRTLYAGSLISIITLNAFIGLKRAKKIKARQHSRMLLPATLLGGAGPFPKQNTELLRTQLATP